MPLTDQKEKNRRLVTKEQKAFLANPDFTKDLPFQKLMEDPKACEEIVQTCTGRRDFHVLEVHPQHSIGNIGARGVRLDAFCKTDTNEYVIVEMQVSNTVDHPRRIRLYAANVDSALAETGMEFRELPDVWFVYITLFDYGKTGFPIYERKSALTNTDRPYEDGLHVIFVNGTINDGSIYAELMQMLKTGKPNDKFKAVSDRMQRFITEQKGEHDMLNCYYPEEWEALMTEVKNNGKAEGKDEGRAEGLLTALKGLMSTSNCGVDEAMAKLAIPPAQQPALRAHFA